MHAARTAQRLHVGRRERPGEPGVAAAQTPLYVVRRQPQLARDHRGIAGGIAQLVGCDADVVGLLRERQTEPVAVEQRAATCLEHDAFGALGLGRRGVLPPFEQLHLGRPHHEREQRGPEADLHDAEPDR